MKTNILISGALLVGAMFTYGCTDLTEEVYSDIPMDKFFQNEQELLMNAGRAYTKLQEYPMEQNLWALGAISSDECVIPTRHDGEWGDNGRWDEIQKHNLTASNKINKTAWEFVFGGISACNEVLYETESSALKFDAKDKIVAEIKILRAMFYYWGVDNWGDVPFTTDFTDKNLPLKKSRKDTYDFIEKEVKDNIGYLDQQATSATYGRVTKGMAFTLLAKMYLNAEVWTGTARWAEARDMCDSVINLNQYSLSDDFSDNFAIKNESSKENIFVIAYSSLLTPECFYWYDLTLHTLSKYSFNIKDQPWDGFMTAPDFFKLYSDQDLRKQKTWLYGTQLDFAGKPIMAVNGGSGNSEKQEFSYNPDITSYTSRADWDGARCCKYQYQTDGLAYDVNDMENDFVLFRYADVLMMKAEAMLRIGDASAATIPGLDKIRTRVGLEPYTAAELTLDELINERGREFAWEGHRRQDLIRFGKWDNAWYQKPVTTGVQHVFPIPQTAIDTNPNLK